jgi:acetyltransferase-like isoleucine patch superfamily enzyme
MTLRVGTHPNAVPTGRNFEDPRFLAALAGKEFGSVSALAPSEMVVDRIDLADAPEGVLLEGQFGENCWLLRDRASAGDATVRITVAPGRVAEDVLIRIGKVHGNIFFRILGPGALCVIGHSKSLTAQIMLGRDSAVTIGDGTTIAGVELVCVRGQVDIGRDCMLSGKISILVEKQHAIVDVETMEIDPRRPAVMVGDHVWLGNSVTLMGDCTVGSGSIVGAHCVAAGNYPDCAVVVGNPGRVIATGKTWSRNVDQIDAGTKDFLSRYAPSHSVTNSTDATSGAASETKDQFQ